MAFGDFFLRDAAGSPERARWLHLARSGSQSQLAIWFILPARGASHIIGHYRNVRGLGKSMVVFRLFEKLRYSNERSTTF